MRALVELIARVSSDDDGDQRLLDIDNTVDDTDATRVSTYQSTQISLNASAADVAVAFGGVTNAALVIILAYDDITVKVNGSGSPAVPVRVTPASDNGVILSKHQKLDQPGLVIWRGKITSLHLGNPSSSAKALCNVVLVGEAA